MSRSAGVLDTKLRAAKKRQSQPMKRNNRKTKQNQIKSWMSCWRVELQRSRSCTLMGIIKIFFKALLFNVVWTEIEFLNKKKKKKRTSTYNPLFHIFLFYNKRNYSAMTESLFNLGQGTSTTIIIISFVCLFKMNYLMINESLHCEMKSSTGITRWNFPFF